jgi:hypothetical protein
VTIAIRPFVGRDDGINKGVSTKAGSEIFLRMGLDTIFAEPPVGQISWLRKWAVNPTSFWALDQTPLIHSVVIPGRELATKLTPFASILS